MFFLLVIGFLLIDYMEITQKNILSPKKNLFLATVATSRVRNLGISNLQITDIQYKKPSDGKNLAPNVGSFNSN